MPLFVGTGYPVDSSAIRLSAANVVQAVNDSFRRVRRFKLFLDSYSDDFFTETVQNGGPGFVQADVTILKSAFTDLNEVRLLAEGESTLAVAKDHLLQGRKLLTVHTNW